MANEKAKQALLDRAEAFCRNPNATEAEGVKLANELDVAEQNPNESGFWADKFYDAAQKVMLKRRSIADQAPQKVEEDDVGDLPQYEGQAGRHRKSRRSRKLRLNVQRRRTQRNGRGRKHRKLRKLATRRR